MAEKFAHPFYVSAEWINCRKAYAKSKGGLCERCMAKGLCTPGTQVHHKVRLTPDNLGDPQITLSWDNLELLCTACHQEEHKGKRRWETDEAGRIIW